jgi:hypothetical protein
MTKEDYLKLPTTKVTYKDITVEDIKILKRLIAAKKLTDRQQHALRRIISMFYNLE